MGHDDDTQFIHRISFIESSLLDFKSSRADDFYQQYNDYTNALEVAIRANVLSPSTTARAASLSFKVYHTVESSLDVESLSEKLMASFLDETTAILEHSTTSSLPPATQVPKSSMPPYIKPSYEWLLSNLHNPYPSRGTRDAISRKSGAARKDVDNWFLDARKRIGWNDARKTYFCNKRADMIHTATRFYANDEKLSISQGAEYALVSIAKKAKDLYCDKFHKTVLASALDGAVEDLTPQTKAGAKAERLRQLQMKKAKDAYPSPERSPEPVDPSPAPCEDIDNKIIQRPITSHKRRDAPVQSIDVDQVEGSRPAKRPRLDGLSSFPSPNIVSLSIGLPSPVSSIDEPLQAASPSYPQSPSQPTLNVPSRKRRLSESDTQDISESPRNRQYGPHPQTASDPISIPSALFDAYSTTPFDGWFEQSFELPNVFEGGDDLPGFDFELGTFPDADFQFGLHTESKQALETAVKPEHPQRETSAKDSSVREVQSLWSDASSSFNPHSSEQGAEIHSFFQVSILTLSITVPVTLKDPCVPPLPSSDFDFINNINGFYSPSAVDSAARPYSLSNPDFSWDFFDMSNPLASDRAFGVTPGQPQLVVEDCSLLATDRSIATLSHHEDHPARPPGQAATRADKIMQLLKMREETFRLELELATR
ncbi:hypothetical protein C0993_002162 [Termitomyces sp. T159_Od127]|nr:hypothetical protein C0993_002162 [Termitomyces sp. T159_Od127]